MCIHFLAIELIRLAFENFGMGRGRQNMDRMRSFADYDRGRSQVKIRSFLVYV